jgi:hypothetical protein
MLLLHLVQYRITESYSHMWYRTGTVRGMHTTYDIRHSVAAMNVSLVFVIALGMGLRYGDEIKGGK